MPDRVAGNARRKDRPFMAGETEQGFMEEMALGGSLDGGLQETKIDIK